MQPTGNLLNAIYVFDLIVVIILITDFFRMRESKQKMNFILKHGYELPAMIPLVLFGLLKSQCVFNIALRDLRVSST